MLKIGLIGCGGIGAVHARCWMLLKDEVQIVAIADKDTERAAKYATESGAKIYADGYKLLENENLDVVDICVPTFLHAEYVIKAMHYVKNIIVEKPICLKEEEAEKILEAQMMTGALVQVAHVVRFTDPYIFLKDIVKSEKYGKVVAGMFSRISPRPVWMLGHDDIEKTGTMYLDMHIHDVDYIRYLMGEPDEVSSWDVRDEEGIIQHIWSAFRFGETMLVAEGSWDYPIEFPFSAKFRVRLEKAAVVLDEIGKLTVYPEDGDRYTPCLQPQELMDLGINVSDIGPYLNEIKYFVEMIKSGNRSGVASVNEAIASFRLIKSKLGVYR